MDAPNPTGLNDEILFQVYRQPITNTKPAKLISLTQFIECTQYPPIRITVIFEKIAEAEATDNQKEKARLKQMYLYYFTPCVVVSTKRAYESITRFTGLLVLDFDHIDNAIVLKQYLFDTYQCIIACYLSPSKRGVKAIVKIPIVNTVDEFKSYYFGIAAEMEEMEHKLDYNTGFDASGQNCVLPLFQSYDPELLFRSEPETWQVKGLKRNDFTASPVNFIPNISHNDRHTETIVKMIKTGFSHVMDYGHPPLRSLCLAIGGYIASGYIDEHEAMQVINYEIETHSYLKKDISGYKKTAQWSINNGKSKPLTLNFQGNG